MNLPATLHYTKDHEWIRVEGDVAFIGITDHAQKELGDIVYVDIDTLDKDVAQHAVFGTVEAVKTVSDLFSPITGTVLEINDKLADAPETVNLDPYGNGWMVMLSRMLRSRRAVRLFLSTRCSPPMRKGSLRLLVA